MTTTVYAGRLNNRGSGMLLSEYCRADPGLTEASWVQATWPSGIQSQLEANLHWGDRVTYQPLSFRLAKAALLAAAALLFACSGPGTPPDTMPAGEPPPVTDAARKPTEFVVLIDNSASIRPPEQVIIREATMLLADLADPGDHIAVVTFGESARTVVSQRLTSSGDREAFKAAVRSGVDFRERFSDIRAGIQLLARDQVQDQDKRQLLPSREAVRAVVLFSDGKLEPKDGKTREAFDQMMADLKGPLAGLPIYTVVLGDTSSCQPIRGLSGPDFAHPVVDPSINCQPSRCPSTPGQTGPTGLALMSTQVASPPNHCYHARKLDELPEIAVTILNDTKGISSLGEDNGTAFRIDSTVELMNLIVRKQPPKAAANADLPTSAQINLIPPDIPLVPGQTPTSAGTDGVYRNQAYQDFDLFVVSKPRPGIWRVTTEGKDARVLSKIVSPIKLRTQLPEQLFSNESNLLQAWLYDERQKVPVRDGYQLQAKVAEPGGLQNSQVFIPLTANATTGTSFMEVPKGIFDALGKAAAPGSIHAQILATKDLDPWFRRQSPILTLEFQEPLIIWRDVPSPLRPIPFMTNEVLLGGTVEKARYQALGFQTPATLRLFVERLNPETGQYTRILDQQIQGVDDGQQLSYSYKTSAADLGGYADYRYGYEYSGILEKSQLRIQSSLRQFRMEPPWSLVAMAAVTLLVVLELLSVFTAKVRGRVQCEKTGLYPAESNLPVSPRRALLSTSIRDCDLGACKFSVRPSRHLFLFKRLCVDGNGAGMTLDKAPLKQGKRVCLKMSGRHTLQWTHTDGDTIVVVLALKV